MAEKRYQFLARTLYYNNTSVLLELFNSQHLSESSLTQTFI